MIKWTPLLWLITIAFASAQEIPIIQTYVLVPEIDDSYTIVNSYLYPSESKGNKFVAATAPDYYVTKLLKDRKDISPLQSRQEEKESKPIRQIYIEMQQPKEIPIISVSVQVPGIAQYLATKEAYPNASQNPPKAALTEDLNSISNLAAPVPPEKKPKIQNINKKIEWKANDVLPLMNFIVEDGIEKKLVKSELISQTGLGQLANQGQARINNLELEKKPTLYNTPSIQKNLITESPFKPSQFIHKPSQPTPKESGPKIPQEYQQLQRIQIANYQTYRNIFYLFISFLVILLTIFLIVRYQRKKRSSIWSTISEKLDNYRYAMPVRQQEEEDKLETMKETVVEEQQD